MTKKIRIAARSLLLLMTSFWFIFALLSGAEEYGGGIQGIIKNSPNALPWLVLYVINIIVWKWELIGGVLVAAAGVFTILFFETYQHPIVFGLISLPLVCLGASFIYCWFVSRKK